MASRIAGDTGDRAAPSRGVRNWVLARSVTQRESPPRQTISAHLLGLDDAGLATFGYDRSAVDRAGRGRFPL